MLNIIKEFYDNSNDIQIALAFIGIGIVLYIIISALKELLFIIIGLIGGKLK